MIRRLSFLKHFVRAVVLLFVLTMTVEIGLRVYDASTGRLTEFVDGDTGIVAKSWYVHHQLKPLQTITRRNPDTKQPVQIVTNSLGLRCPEPAVPKPAGVYRILCLGDGSVLGAEVPEAETFCVRLQQLLQSQTQLQVEVINAGVPGYCPLLSYLQVKHGLLALQPDLFIVNFDMSDVAEDYRYRRHTLLSDTDIPLACPEPTLESQNASKKNPVTEHSLIARWSKKHMGWLWKENVKAEQEQEIDSLTGRYAWLDDPQPTWSIHVQQSLSPIEQLGVVAEGIQAWMVVATYPAPWQVSATASSGPGVRERAGVPRDAVYTSRVPFEILKEFSQRRAFVLCDASPAFQQSENADQLFLHNAAHFSKLGHELYARQLATCLQANIPGIWNNSSRDQSLPEPRQAFATPR